MMSFVIYRLNSVYSQNFNGNWYQTKILFCLSLIVNSCFYADYFDYLIDYIYFVRNFVNFFVLVIYLYNLSNKVIGFLNNWNYLEVVYQSCYYYVYFCLVNFGLFSCIDRMIYLVLCTFLVCSGYLVAFVYIRQYCVRIFGNNYTIF